MLRRLASALETARNTLWPSFTSTASRGSKGPGVCGPRAGGSWRSRLRQGSPVTLLWALVEASQSKQSTRSGGKSEMSKQCGTGAEPGRGPLSAELPCPSSAPTWPCPALTPLPAGQGLFPKFKLFPCLGSGWVGQLRLAEHGPSCSHDTKLRPRAVVQQQRWDGAKALRVQKRPGPHKELG